MIARAITLAAIFVATAAVVSQAQKAPAYEPVAALPYRVVDGFFKLPPGINFGEVAGVAVNSENHIFVFQRTKPMLVEFDREGKFVRELGDGLFDHPHGLRIDAEDNIWATDDASHHVVKLDKNGRVLLVLGKRGMGAEAEWLFNSPTDVAFDKRGNIYIADGYGNSRVVKFDRTGRFLKSWGSYGTRPGEFDLPHSIVIDGNERVYVGDRENQRIQIFDTEGKFLKEWTGIGYPYGLCLGPNGNIWMADGGHGRVVELGRDGRIVGALGEPGRAPGEFAWAHFLAFARDGRLFVADVLNWRAQVFAPTGENPGVNSYVPTVRKFWESKPSTGWSNQQKKP